MSERNPNPWQGANPAVGLGLQLAVGMAVFTGGGLWLDRKRGGGVLFTLLGVGLGLFYCGYEIWKVARRMSEENAASPESESQQHDPKQ